MLLLVNKVYFSPLTAKLPDLCRKEEKSGFFRVYLCSCSFQNLPPFKSLLLAFLGPEDLLTLHC